MKFYDWEYERVVSEWTPISQYLYFSSNNSKGFTKTYLQFLKENFWSEDQKLITLSGHKKVSTASLEGALKTGLDVALSASNIVWDSRFIRISRNNSEVNIELDFENEESRKAFLLNLTDLGLRDFFFYERRVQDTNGMTLYIKVS